MGREIGFGASHTGGGIEHSGTGQSNPENRSENEKYCSKCGEYFSSKFNFCGFCGGNLKEIEDIKDKQVAGFLTNDKEREKIFEENYTIDKRIKARGWDDADHYQMGFLGEIPQTSYFKGIDNLEELEKKATELEELIRGKYILLLEKAKTIEEKENIQEEFKKESEEILNEFYYYKTLFKKREQEKK